METFYLCIAFRIALLVLAYRLKGASPAHREAAAAAAAAVGVGFLAVWGRRMRAFESTARGGRVWWDDLRPLHGALYLLFAVLAYRGVEHAWAVLALDVAIGIAAWRDFRRN